MDLKDTVSYMTSDDYKDRFLAEYYQLKIRLEKLCNMYNNWNNLSFTPTCPKTMYDHQIEYMRKYLKTLEVRAELEDIDLRG